MQDPARTRHDALPFLLRPKPGKVVGQQVPTPYAISIEAARTLHNDVGTNRIYGMTQMLKSA